MSGVWARAFLIVVGSVFGSGGLWTYLSFKSARGNATTRLLMGVAYDKITTLGLMYIERGSITMDEFEDFQKYFFEPYAALGGNGVAERISLQVKNLPFRPHAENPSIFHNSNERVIPNVRVISPSGPDAAFESPPGPQAPAQ